MNKRWIAVSLALVVALYVLWPSGKRYPPGVLIATEPRVVTVESATSWPFQSKDKSYDITPRAKYALEARVLSTNPDYGDALIGPVDIVVGWGPMSDSHVLDQLKIWQDNTRHWFCSPRGSWPIPVGEAALHAVNTHIIPASPMVENHVKSLRKGDLIALEGSLVDVTRKDGFHWRTSVDPSGFGEHSCKIIWVEKLSVR